MDFLNEQINLEQNDGEKKEFELIPDGKYTGMITLPNPFQDAIKTSRNDNKYVNLEITLDNGRKIWQNFMLTGKGTFMLSAAAKSTGKVAVDSLTMMEILALVSKYPVEFEVGTETYEWNDEEKTKNVIVKFLPKAYVEEAPAVDLTNVDESNLPF